MNYKRSNDAQALSLPSRYEAHKSAFWALARD